MGIKSELPNMFSSLPWHPPRVLTDDDVKRIFTDVETEVHFLAVSRDTRPLAVPTSRYLRHLAKFTNSKSLISFLSTPKVPAQSGGPPLLEDVNNSPISSQSPTPPLFRIFHLQQRDTWSRIALCYDAFRSLSESVQASDALTDLVRNFGLKVEPSDEMHISLTFQSRMMQGCAVLSHEGSKTGNSKDREQQRVTEICYNIRYFARHGRPGVKSLWSERQAAVYHCLNEDAKASQLITIQVPEELRRRVEAVLGDAPVSDEMDLAYHLGCHVVMFFGLAADWRSYLCFLEGVLAKLDEPALHSKVGLGNQETHVLTFSNAQRLERVRRKVTKARHILARNAEVATRWIRAVETLASRHGGGEHFAALIGSVRKYIAELDSHSAAAALLLERLSGTQKLIYHTLDYRNEELVIQSTLPLNSSNEKLLLQLQQLSLLHDSMHEIASDFASDSKWIKILTFITTLYAAGSFAAGILSTNFVTTVAISDAVPQTRLAMASGFWVFPVLVVLFIVVTLVAAVVWWKYWPQWWKYRPRRWARVKKNFLNIKELLVPAT
ncbi:hypothetical protein F5144DRAFT_4494 [Chaetomium tenue]|uniref:Uncharacterized protein n=1 Tax=Chaetomium tenue TaxID=1854479 RepID=A0ACB7PQP6_9PEZI|nr:hypothetical protein F5144DRAFT_4494 [Chaetomium globosum]